MSGNLQKKKLYDIMSLTQDNYANMLKRLDRKSKFSNFTLIYYSITLIVYSITTKYFPIYYNNTLSEYFGIIISVIILAYSIVISNAKYQERIKNAENILNQIKGLKRRLKKGKINKISEEYQRITCGAEYRSDIDFFRTLKQRCRKYNICWFRYKRDIIFKNENKDFLEMLKIKEYLDETSPYIQQIKIWSDYFLSGVIMILPIILFLTCIFFRNFQ